MPKNKISGATDRDSDLEQDSPISNPTDLVTCILIKLGNPSPSSHQRELIKTLLSNITLNAELLFDSQLTQRETESLTLASLGYTVSESAKLLAIKRTTVEGYHRSIREKLGCKTIARAVMAGIQYGWIKK